MQTKVCSKCKIEQPLDDFYNDNKSKDNKTSQCKTCMITYRQNHKTHYRDYMRKRRNEDNEFIKEIRRNSWRNLDVKKKLFQQSKNRSKTKGIEFNIEVEDIIVPERCPILKVPFVIGTKDNYEYTHSIDRIDNSKGYIKGNIQVITKKANSMKNSASKEELIQFALYILNEYKDDDIVQTNRKLLEL